MMEEVVTVHYDEIALKGKNRPFFQNKLLDNIREKTGAVPELKDSRVVIRSTDESVFDKLRLTPGVSWFGKGLIIDRDENVLKDTLKDLVSVAQDNRLNLDVKRVDKSFDKTSLKIKETLCRVLKIKLDKKAQKVRIDIMRDSFIINYAIERAIGGLPVGSAGKIISLFSGGIDSSVAPIELMKRGASVDLLHVYATANSSAAIKGKISKLASLISRVGGVNLYLVPFHTFSIKAMDIDQRYELVMFKRFLLKLAQSISLRYGYKGICSGDSLSQVASQTLDNINSISAGIDTPVFRPLIGYNKDEIIQKAKRYGTYDASIEDYKDCCSLVSKNPATSARKEKVLEIEKVMGLDEIVEKSLNELEVKSYLNWPQSDL